MPNSFEELQSIAYDYFAIPDNSTFWDLLNSPFIVGIVVAAFGWQLNRRFNKTQKIAEYAEKDSATAMRIANGASDAIEPDEEEFAEDNIDSIEAEVGASSSGEVLYQSDAIPPQEDYRKHAAAIVRKAKDLIELKIESDQDQRHQKTYAKISGHHPIDRTYALSDRGQLNRDQERGLITLLRNWKRYGSGRGAQNPVPKAVYEQIQRDWKLVESAS